MLPEFEDKYVNKIHCADCLTLLPDDKKQMRILYATPKEIPPGKLFEYSQKANQAIAEHREKAAQAIIKKTAEKLSVK